MSSTNGSNHRTHGVGVPAEVGGVGDRCLEMSVREVDKRERGRHRLAAVTLDVPPERLVVQASKLGVITRATSELQSRPDGGREVSGLPDCPKRLQARIDCRLGSDGSNYRLSNCSRDEGCPFTAT